MLYQLSYSRETVGRSAPTWRARQASQPRDNGRGDRGRRARLAVGDRPGKAHRGGACDPARAVGRRHPADAVACGPGAAGRRPREPARHAAGPAEPERARRAGPSSTSGSSRSSRTERWELRVEGEVEEPLRTPMAGLPRPPPGRGRLRLPLRHRLQQARHELQGSGLRDHRRARSTDARRDARHVLLLRRVLDEPAARGGAEAGRSPRPPRRRRAPSRRSTAARCGW